MHPRAATSVWMPRGKGRDGVGLVSGLGDRFPGHPRRRPLLEYSRMPGSESNGSAQPPKHEVARFRNWRDVGSAVVVVKELAVRGGS